MTRPRAVVLAVVVVAVTGTVALLASRGDPAQREQLPPAAWHEPAAGEVCWAHAAPWGSDDSAGDRDEPVASVDELLARLPEGGTGCLLEGEYDGDVTLLRDRTTLRSVPGERARLLLDTLTVPADVADAVVSHLEIVGGNDALTVSLIGDRFTFERNEVTNEERGTSCLLIGSSDHRTVGGTIRSNVIHGCGRTGDRLSHGIYAQNVGPPSRGSTGLLIEGNVVHDVAGYAVQLYPRAESAVVRRNLIDGGGRAVQGGIVLDGPVSRGHRIEENVIARTRTGAVVQRTGTGHVSRDNCLVENDDSVTGSDISRRGNTVDERCWQSADLWAAAGRPEAAAPCHCPADDELCDLVGSDGLCRLLDEYLAKEES